MKKKISLIVISVLVLSLVLSIFTACNPTDPVKYTVTFNTQGGSTVASQSIESGNKVTKPADPTKAGYTFKGWSKKADSFDEFDFTVGITANTTIYAIWEAATTKYTVTFNTQGGSTVTSQSVDSGKKATKPADPSYGDKVFVCWSENSDYLNYIYTFDFTSSITENITLYALWADKDSATGVLFKAMSQTKQEEDVVISMNLGMEVAMVFKNGNCILEYTDMGFAKTWFDGEYTYSEITMGETYYYKTAAEADDEFTYSAIGEFFDGMFIPSNIAFKAGSDNKVITFSDDDADYEITLENGLIKTIDMIGDDGSGGSMTIVITFIYSSTGYKLPDYEWIED